MSEVQEILDIVVFMRDRMATKDDLAELESRMASKMDLADLERRMATKDDISSVRADIRSLSDRVEVVETKVDNLAGVTKEIDYLLGEVVAIKKHVGMEA
jgi:hypothetical protein